MSYIAAKEVLPDHIVELIQKYVQGECIYIPKKDNSRSAWGSKNNTRDELNERNCNIYSEYMSGTDRNTLADKYFLTKKSIDRIILKEKCK